MPIRLLSRGGDLLMVGMYAREFPFFPSAEVRAELTFHLTHASTYRDYSEAIELIRTNVIGLKTLAQLFPLDHLRRHFEKPKPAER